MPIEATGELAYVKLVSVVRQAGCWNEVLQGDAISGPSSGYVVGVGPRIDGRYPLVWVRHRRVGPDEDEAAAFRSEHVPIDDAAGTRVRQ
jgi:hypothetical protein